MILSKKTLHVNTFSFMLKKILNPFPSLPLRQALCWGIVALILSAIFCWQLGLRVTSLTQVNYAGGSLASATLQQVVVWLLFAVVLYVAALIFSREKVHFWDVAAYNLFARIPFDVMLLIFAIPMVRSVTGLVMDGSMATATQYATTLLLVGVVSLIFAAWYFYWSYKAFAQTTSLRNGRGVGIFITCYILCYILSGFVMRFV